MFEDTEKIDGYVAKLGKWENRGKGAKSFWKRVVIMMDY